jgi:hypothetical protein
MKERSSIGLGYYCTRSGGSRRYKLGGKPIELHLLFVPECKLAGRRLKHDAPGAAAAGENKLGNKKDRQVAGQPVFKRPARQSGLFGPFARSSFSQQFDRSGLRTAWKYVYLFRADNRLTRYVE